MMDLPTAIQWHNFPEIDYILEHKGKGWMLDCIITILNNRQ